MSQIGKRLLAMPPVYLALNYGYRVQTTYVLTGYFDYSHDRVLGAVYRPEFETHLHLHFEGLQPDDLAHYALRNAIYAIGCRAAALMDNSAKFADIQQLSLRYFQNALSVYTDLLYMPSGLTAVEALIAMVRW